MIIMEGEFTIAEEVAARLSIPVSAVTVYACPICGLRVFAGYLGRGSAVNVRCSKSNCAHHLKGAPWTVRAPGSFTRSPQIQRCQGSYAKHPCKTRAPGMDSEHVHYAKGSPVCNWAWSRAYLAPGTRIVVWCKQSTCVNRHSGFILVL